MPLRVMEHVTEIERDDDRLWYEIDPAQVYPATIAYLRDEALDRDYPSDSSFALLKRRAEAVDDQAWEDAEGPGDELDAERRAQRAEVLEVARLWFTELLHRAIDHAPMGLHITKDEAWRL